MDPSNVDIVEDHVFRDMHPHPKYLIRRRATVGCEKVINDQVKCLPMLKDRLVNEKHPTQLQRTSVNKIARPPSYTNIIGNSIEADYLRVENGLGRDINNRRRSLPLIGIDYSNGMKEIALNYFYFLDLNRRIITKICVEIFYVRNTCIYM